MKRTIMNYFSDTFVDEPELESIELEEKEKQTDEDSECEIC
ncbi:hypothetical protein [Phocicoccus pinnipedialis]|uniref:Uncharacterized protein n=1 Tax=Phocicoccus pinnipedialis TaxID=110845 RepID=A0A6V7RCY6_9BACL|nr:hypothetical protein [Jeotgalicoccus pinnipedialis]MBP1939875.1 hypothetical protein [Jeotgalicoccus pinnipedialis]CAD2074657.1 hypothetical protein JEOPIN946_00809 [Jeotgalicoccus pinnipedialis]